MVSKPRYQPVKVSTGSIGSVDALCDALDISRKELEDARSLSVDQRYTRKETPKKDGSLRVVHNPHFLIRKIQRRINNRIFSNPSVIHWPDHIFGSVPNATHDSGSGLVIEKDYISCARQHCGAKSVMSLDIKDFFDNIHADSVVEIFSKFLRYSDEVAEALADLCCRGESVVQGALTSSYIASLCLFGLEGDLVRKLRYKGLVYTRFVDDITISSKVVRYDFSHAKAQVETMLNSAGLPLNSKKTKIQNASIVPLLVHGLRVDFKEPRLPPSEPGRIRASVHNLEALAAAPGYRASRSYRKDFNRCMGRVNKLARVGHSQHSLLLRRLRSILPLPSHKDIERADQLLNRLSKDALKPGYVDSYWFYKRFYVAAERIAIIKRSFPKTGADLAARLRTLHPGPRHD